MKDMIEIPTASFSRGEVDKSVFKEVRQWSTTGNRNVPILALT